MLCFEGFAGVFIPGIVTVVRRPDDLLQREGICRGLPLFDDTIASMLSRLAKFNRNEKGYRTCLGYVLSPADPIIIVNDLDEWRAGSDVWPAFKHLAGDWYLFEFVH